MRSKLRAIYYILRGWGLVYRMDFPADTEMRSRDGKPIFILQNVFRRSLDVRR